MDIDVKELKAKVDKFQATLEAHVANLDKKVDEMTGNKTHLWLAGAAFVGFIVGCIVSAL